LLFTIIIAAMSTQFAGLNNYLNLLKLSQSFYEIIGDFLNCLNISFASYIIV